ncbi:hypothetical protein MCEKH45_01379 [Methylophilaceae bacterium]|jgi:hypothetical protein
MQQGIPLNKTAPATNSGSAFKSVALATFKFLRASSAQASKLPGILQQASSDIVEAWQESASPKR